MAAYSFKDVVVVIDGPGGGVSLSTPGGFDESVPVGNFAIGSLGGVADEGISVEKAEDRNTQLRGNSGEVLNLNSSSMAGVVKIRLLKTSSNNGRLMQMLKTQRSDASSWGLNIISIEDKARGDKITCSEAAFSGEPSLFWGKVAQVQEWTFHAGFVDGYLS